MIRLNLVLPISTAASICLFKPLYAIGSVPSLSCRANAYRWRSLPRVRRHRTSKPQGSSTRILPWQVTMDQLVCASLSQTHYGYEMGMLKVPAVVPWGIKRAQYFLTNCTSYSSTVVADISIQHSLEMCVYCVIYCKQQKAVSELYTPDTYIFRLYRTDK